MKKKLRGLILAAVVGLLIGLVAGLAFGQAWSERRRGAAETDARVALEARLVKLEVDLTNYNRRLDWMEKVIWGAIVGLVAMFGKEVMLACFNRQNRRDQAPPAAPE